MVMRRWYDSDLAVLALVWICAAVYLPGFIDRGWIPHDEGVVAHSAERVLQGELPHRDFDEIYTGGLSHLHALGFALFGTRLLALRWMLLVVALAFVPALYAIARRVVPPPLAGALTLLGLVWSVPNYFAGLPSWYNLFTATFGTLALLRFLEDERRIWLVLAGVCGGLSILVKIAGLYFVAAALLFLVYHEQVRAQAQPRAGAGRAWALLAALAVATVGLAVGSIRVFARGLDGMALVHFVVPGTALVGLLLWCEVRDGRGPSAWRLGRLTGLVTPFVLGVALPIAIFLAPYAMSGAIGDVVRGVFVLPARRVESAAMALPPLATLLAVLPFALVLVAPAPRARSVELALAAVLAAALAAVLATAGSQSAVYTAVWYGIRPLVPLTAVVAAVTLARLRPSGPPPVAAREAAYLLVAVASFVSLVQFPYAFGIYFCYAAPLVALAIAALVRLRPASRPLHGVALAFYLAFAVLWLNPGYIRAIGLRFIADGQTARLDVPRGGILVYGDNKLQYERVVALVQAHSPGGFIYAAPDSPEVYFLTSRANPTRTIFDIFDDLEGRTPRILAAIDANDVRVVVVNSRPEFSPRLAPELVQGLAARFPNWESAGRFAVGWR